MLINFCSKNGFPPQYFLFPFLNFLSDFSQTIRHICDFFSNIIIVTISFIILQLESPHNSFPVLQEICVHQQLVLWELKKCNYMCEYLTSLTHLLISSYQPFTLCTLSSLAPRTLCGQGAVLVFMDMPAVLEPPVPLPSTSASLHVFFDTEVVDSKYVA